MNGNTASEPASPTEGAIRRLAKLAGDLYEHMDGLRAALSPVLQANAPVAVGNSKEVAIPTSSVPLIARVEEITERLDTCLAVINDVHGRLAI